MSRLDSFIRRVTAQRSCLDLAVGMIADIRGPVMEIGLGNGRTYDHLREKLPDRHIVAFDRCIASHPSSTPDPAFVVLGDLRETLPAVGERLDEPAALAHADIGSGDPVVDADLAGFLSRTLPELMAPAGLVLCDQPLRMPGWHPLPLPTGIAAGRYFLYRRARPPAP